MKLFYPYCDTFGTKRSSLLKNRSISRAVSEKVVNNSNTSVNYLYIWEFRGQNEDNSMRHSLSFGERSDPQIYQNFSHGIPKFTAFTSIPFFSRDLISESLDPASGSQKGLLSHDAPLTQLTNCHHDPVVQMLPDHVNFEKSRVAQRCLVNIYQGTRGTRFAAEATRTFREERLHSWLTS